MAELDRKDWVFLPNQTCQKKPQKILLDHWNLQNLTEGDVIFLKYTDGVKGTTGPVVYRWDGEVFRLVDNIEELTDQQKAELMVAMMGQK